MQILISKWCGIKAANLLIKNPLTIRLHQLFQNFIHHRAGFAVFDAQLNYLFEIGFIGMGIFPACFRAGFIYHAITVCHQERAGYVFKNIIAYFILP